jgi:hypothetical protein
MNAAPPAGDERRAGVRIHDGQQLADLAYGHPKFAEPVYDLGGRHPPQAVVAVAGLSIHPIGFEQPGVVIAAQHLDAQVSDAGELTYRQTRGHGPSLNPPREEGSSPVRKTPLTLPLGEASRWSGQPAEGSPTGEKDD